MKYKLRSKDWTASPLKTNGTNTARDNKPWAFEPFQFLPLWSHCFIFYNILYISRENKSFY